MTRSTILTPARILAGIAFILLLLSFRLNAFRIVPHETFLFFQNDSQTLIDVKLEELVRGQSVIDGGFLRMNEPYFRGDVQAIHSSLTKRYVSQFGFQGLSIALLQGTLGLYPSQTIALAEWIVAGLNAFVLAFFIGLLASRYGTYPAIAALGLIVMSVDLVLYGRNLYWVLFTLLLPIVFAFWLYPKGATCKRTFHHLLLLVGAAMFVKCLCGYEFITVLALSAVPCIVFHGLIQRLNLRQIATHAVLVFGVCVLAFTLAIATHFLTLSAALGGTTNAYSAISDRVSKNTVDASPLAENEIKAKYTTPVIGQLFLLLKYLSLPAFNLGVHPSFGDRDYYAVRVTHGGAFLSSLLFAGLLWIRSYRRIPGGEDSPRKNRALSASLILAFPCSISWIILARVHSIQHLHLVSIVFSIPFLMHFYACIASALSKDDSEPISLQETASAESNPSVPATR